MQPKWDAERIEKHGFASRVVPPKKEDTFVVIDIGEIGLALARNPYYKITVHLGFRFERTAGPRDAIRRRDRRTHGGTKAREIESRRRCEAFQDWSSRAAARSRNAQYLLDNATARRLGIMAFRFLTRAAVREDIP
jgi:hypothetical protein